MPEALPSRYPDCHSKCREEYNDLISKGWKDNEIRYALTSILNFSKRLRDDEEYSFSLIRIEEVEKVANGLDKLSKKQFFYEKVLTDSVGQKHLRK